MAASISPSRFLLEGDLHIGQTRIPERLGASSVPRSQGSGATRMRALEAKMVRGDNCDNENSCHNND